MELSTPMTDTQAFDALLQQHRGIVRKIAAGYARSAEDRADLAQEIAVQLWRAWPGYDASRSFSTWMYRIALNTAITFLRGDLQRRRHAVPLDEQVHDLADDNAFDPEAHERVQLLQRFMATLAPLDRALLLLYLEERSGREIAEVLGIGESNVTTRVGRLKQRLRDFARPVSTSAVPTSRIPAHPTSEA
jgi:RNA polymerase sigma factor (sigma-70 family)